jgi:hypothetical protein
MAFGFKARSLTMCQTYFKWVAAIENATLVEVPDDMKECEYSAMRLMQAEDIDMPTMLISTDNDHNLEFNYCPVCGEYLNHAKELEMLCAYCGKPIRGVHVSDKKSGLSWCNYGCKGNYYLLQLNDKLRIGRR